MTDDDVDLWVIEIEQAWLDTDGWPDEVRLESPDGQVAECEVVYDE